MTKRRTKPPSPDLLTRLFNDMALSLRLLLDRRVSGTAKLIPVITALYMISPLDFVPDLLLPFGVVDDIGAFLLGLQLFIRSAPPNVVAQYRGGGQSAPERDDAPGRVPDREQFVIEGTYTERDDSYQYDYDPTVTKHAHNKD